MKEMRARALWLSGGHPEVLSRVVLAAKERREGWEEGQWEARLRSVKAEHFPIHLEINSLQNRAVKEAGLVRILDKCKTWLYSARGGSERVWRRGAVRSSFTLKK